MMTAKLFENGRSQAVRLLSFEIGRSRIYPLDKQPNPY